LPQLRFPIAAGISGTEAYKDATLRGKPESTDPPIGEGGLLLETPEALTLNLIPTPAGRLPAIGTSDDVDFATLVCALSKRNEPFAVPESMGACIISGYNNWERIRDHKEAWSKANPGGDWAAEFQTVKPRKDLYQDRFLILSGKGYSGIPAARVNLAEDEWRLASLAIRRAHEGTHYATLRLFGSMRNRVLDELVADLFGILEAFGEYRPDLALLFLGLENAPSYRSGGRLENYRGEPPLSDGAFRILQRLTVDAVASLGRICRGDDVDPTLPEGKSLLLRRLTRLSLEELAAGKG
jgi:hypothetical protein